MFDLCRNQVVGFYWQNVSKTPVEEWHFKERCRSVHFASKHQLPGLSVIGRLVENGLINRLKRQYSGRCLFFKIALLKNLELLQEKSVGEPYQFSEKLLNK